MKTVTLLASLFFLVFPVEKRPDFCQYTSDHNISGMKAIIQRLDNNIKQANPKLYATLNAPLSEAEIHALEVEHKLALPPDLKELYRWKNGQNLDNGTVSFLGNETFLSLQEALGNRDFLNEELFAKTPEDHFKIKNWWNKDWIPVFENGGGDYTCYDPVGVFSDTKGQMLGYYHDENYRSVMAPSLESFLQSVCLVYEKVYEDEWDSFKAVKGYPKSYDIAPR